MPTQLPKHTPGPWSAKQGEPYFGNYHTPIWGQIHGQKIATVTHKNEQHEANAALIAAAPTLLKSLERLVDIIDRDDTPIEWRRHYASSIQAAEDAVALAKGGSGGSVS